MVLVAVFTFTFIAAGCERESIPYVSVTQTLSSSCVDVEVSKPITKSQYKYIADQAYNFLYINDETIIKNIYSLNKADTVCSTGSPDVWKVVSGFIVDLNQPNKALYYPGGKNTGDGNFAYIYAKARFIDQDGKAHDYWLQFQGNPPGYWFELAQWDKPVSESKNRPGLTAMKILATGKNSDDTSSYIDANRIIPDGLLKLNDQFIAVVHVGYINGDEGFTSTDTLKQFVNAVEGKGKFPVAPDGFFLPVQAMIVSSRP
jgi:hypothetical protein